MDEDTGDSTAGAEQGQGTNTATTSTNPSAQTTAGIDDICKEQGITNRDSSTQETTTASLDTITSLADL